LHGALHWEKDPPGIGNYQKARKERTLLGQGGLGGWYKKKPELRGCPRTRFSWIGTKKDPRKKKLNRKVGVSSS